MGFVRFMLVIIVVTALTPVTWWLTLPNVEELGHRTPTTTAFIELRREQAEKRGEPFNLRWEWRKLNRISPYLRHAVVSAEDAKFYKHQGVDWNSLRGVVKTALEERRLGRGASTLTQQVAKNLYLSPSRNPLRKITEVAIAKRLEQHLTKQQILELYLNIAEWGDGVFGAEAASRHWYHKSAARLRPREAARLAVALPNPSTRSPKVRSRKLQRKAAYLVRTMRWAKLTSE